MPISISDKIYLHSKHAQNKDLLATLTYKNPEYYQKMNLGLSVWKTPKVLKTYEEKDGKLVVLRGEFGKVRRFIKEEVVSDHPRHEPVNLHYINNDFALDSFQEGAVKAILSCRQGVVHAVTSAGKSLIILKAICERNLPALIVVHRKILMQQFLEDIEKYVRDSNNQKIRVGIIGNGRSSTGKITIAIDKSLGRNLESYRDKFGIVFLDECHLCPADTMFRIINTVNSEHKFGVSGTLRRKDAKEFLIFATFGSVIYTITKEQLLAQKRVVPIDTVVVETDTRFNYDQAVEELGTTRAYQLMEKTVSLDPGRNQQVTDLVATLAMRGEKTLVLSKLVQPCYFLQQKLEKETGIQAGIITGKDAQGALQSYDQMKHGDLKVIFATIGCVSTGVSISDLDNIILIAPLYTNELLLHQIRGRLMRIAPGKKKGVLHYFYDQHIFNERKLKKFLNIMES